MSATTKPEELEQKFRDKSVITDTCWLWQGASSRGHGYISFMGNMYPVYRLAYMLLVDEIPDGLDVLHKCDDGRCWRPDHLFVGTAKDNMHDMIEKGRSGDRNPTCERAHHVRLSAEDVRTIRYLVEQEHQTYQSVAELYETTKSHVGRIVRRESWGDLD